MYLYNVKSFGKFSDIFLYVRSLNWNLFRDDTLIWGTMLHLP